MFNEVSYLTLLTVNRLKIDLCKSNGTIWMRKAVGILIRLWVGKKQNIYRFAHLTRTTDCYLVDL